MKNYLIIMLSGAVWPSYGMFVPPQHSHPHATSARSTRPRNTHSGTSDDDPYINFPVPVRLKLKGSQYAVPPHIRSLQAQNETLIRNLNQGFNLITSSSQINPGDEETGSDDDNEPTIQSHPTLPFKRSPKRTLNSPINLSYSETDPLQIVIALAKAFNATEIATSLTPSENSNFGIPQPITIFHRSSSSQSNIKKPIIRYNA